MAGPAARITIDPSDGRRGRCRRRGRTARSPEQDASDRLAPTRNVTRRGVRGRGPVFENSFGGEVFFLNSPLPYSHTPSAPTANRSSVSGPSTVGLEPGQR